MRRPRRFKHAVAEARISVQRCRNGRTSESGPLCRCEPGDLSQRRRNLVGSQVAQNLGGNRNDPLPDGLR
jgi:hypothetical protein